MKVFWEPRAIRDLNNIALYVAEDNPVAAVEMVTLIQERVANLSDFPHIGRKGRVKGSRELIIPPYIVAYEITDDEIDIKAIYHGRQKWPDQL